MSKNETEDQNLGKKRLNRGKKNSIFEKWGPTLFFLKIGQNAFKPKLY